MKVQIVKQELLKTLQLAQEISEKDNINSYFSCLVFIASKDTITIKSSNRQSTFEQTLVSNEFNKIRVLESGSYLIPGIKLLNMVNSLNDGLIMFESKDYNLHVVEDGKNKSDIEFDLKMRNIEEYPVDIHSLEKIENCVIDKDSFYTIINNTSFAVSSNLKDSSLFLTGVFFDIEDTKLTAVATDRNRLSLSSIEVQDLSNLNVDKDQDIIVPLKSIMFLKKILSRSDAKSEISISINKDKIFFYVEDIIFSSNIISGKYYSYKRIIPEENNNQVIVNTNELKQAITRVSVASDSRKENNVLFTIEAKKIILSAEDKDKSFAKETVTAELRGKPNNFLVKSQFILEPLQIIKSQKVSIMYGDTIKDLIRISSLPQDNTLHIIAQIKQ